MNYKLIFKVAIITIMIITNVFILIWSSSGKSASFNSLTEDIARSRRKYDDKFTSEEVRGSWKAMSIFALVFLIIALIIVIANKGEVLVIE